MSIETWYLIAGVLLVTTMLLASFIGRLPLTVTVIYLAVGLILGPIGFNLFSVDPLRHSELLERLSEIAVIVSLFTAGLKLRLPLQDKLWRIPVVLAFVSMTLTVGLIAAAGFFLLGLPLGAAVLLGAILAPTDPVLASDLQLEHARDRNRLRFNLTAEAGLNDGTAFPFVMLGLGLLGVHEIGAYGWRWLAVDVIWAIGAGLAIGTSLGILTGKLVLYLRRVHKEGVGRDEFLVLGLIALSYGLALKAHAYGFLAVFAAGLALRTIERLHTNGCPPPDLPSGGGALHSPETATHPKEAPVYLAQVVLTFNEQVERLVEVALVLILAGMLSTTYFSASALWFIPLFFLVIRPLAVYLGLLRSSVAGAQKNMISWFGIRGIGSIYYLMYAIEHGVPPELAVPLTELALSTIAVSIVAHGISVTPLMKWYERQAEKRRVDA